MFRILFLLLIFSVSSTSTAQVMMANNETLIFQEKESSAQIMMANNGTLIFQEKESSEEKMMSLKDMQEYRDPWKALIISAFVTGGGQLYNKQKIKGLAAFAAGVTGFYIAFADASRGENTGNLGMLLYLGAAGFSMVDAWKSANKINKENGLAF